MKIERGDVGVGLTVAGALVVVVGAWLWLTRPDKDYFALYTEFDVVEGLNEQTPLRLQGFAVGRIRSIRPETTAQGATVFRVEMGVDRKFLGADGLRIPEGTLARVAYPPVVGPPFIILEPPPEGGPALEEGAEIAGLRTEPFLDQIQVLTGQLSYTVTETLLRTVELMDSVQGTLQRLDRTLDMTTSAVPGLLETVEASLASAEALMVKVTAELDTTAPLMRASLDSANALLGDSRRLMGDVEGILATSQPRAETILASLDSLTFMLNHFVRQVSERPTRLLTGVRPPPPMIR